MDDARAKILNQQFLARKVEMFCRTMPFASDELAHALRVVADQLMSDRCDADDGISVDPVESMPEPRKGRVYPPKTVDYWDGENYHYQQLIGVSPTELGFHGVIDDQLEE